MATLKPFVGDYRQHDEGKIYQAYIKAYEFGTGDFGDYIRWDIVGKEIADDTAVLSSMSLSVKTKLGGWVKAIFPSYDFVSEFDLDTLIGMPVAVTFEHTEKPDGGFSETGNIVAKGDGEPRDFASETAPF